MRVFSKSAHPYKNAEVLTLPTDSSDRFVRVLCNELDVLNNFESTHQHDVWSFPGAGYFQVGIARITRIKKPRHSHGGAFVFQRVTQTCGSPTCRIFMPLVPPVVW